MMKELLMRNSVKNLRTARFAVAAFVFLLSVFSVCAVARGEASQQGDPPQQLLDLYHISLEDFQIGREVQILVKPEVKPLTPHEAWVENIHWQAREKARMLRYIREGNDPQKA